MWSKGNPCVLLVGMQIGAAIMENSMEFHKRIKNEIPFWPSNSSSGNLSEETKNTNSKECMYPYVLCGIIYNSQDLEAALVHAQVSG